LPQLSLLIEPANQPIIDATPNMVQRFVRGYTLRTFANHPDPVKHTAVMLNLACQWRQVAAVAATPPALQTTAWQNLVQQTWGGRDAAGRVVHYIRWPLAALLSLPSATTRAMHTADLLALEREKDAASAAAVLAGLHPAPIHHHVMVIDMANDDHGAGVSRAMLKYMQAAASHSAGPSFNMHFFPDVLETAIIINAPLLFRALWTVAKRFLSAETAAKFIICGTEYRSTLQAAGIGPAALPRCCAGFGIAPNPIGVKSAPTITKLKLKKEGAGVEHTVAIPNDAVGVAWCLTILKGEKCRIAVVSPGRPAQTGTICTTSPKATKGGTVGQVGKPYLTGVMEVAPSAAGEAGRVIVRVHNMGKASVTVELHTTVNEATTPLPTAAPITTVLEAEGAADDAAATVTIESSILPIESNVLPLPSPPATATHASRMSDISGLLRKTPSPARAPSVECVGG
jgi:hypothetical protein